MKIFTCNSLYLLKQNYFFFQVSSGKHRTSGFENGKKIPACQIYNYIQPSQTLSPSTLRLNFSLHAQSVYEFNSIILRKISTIFNPLFWVFRTSAIRIAWIGCNLINVLELVGFSSSRKKRVMNGYENLSEFKFSSNPVSYLLKQYTNNLYYGFNNFKHPSFRGPGLGGST